uniref:Dolichol-phosphate mannosyltransferase subunit 1 n=1 Tax=Piliocolobus tephrosceles TaxID=591936 RepID=A0A8C9H026_9PRIM
MLKPFVFFLLFIYFIYFKINMSQACLYSVIIPTYNEKENIPYVVNMIVNELKGKDINFEIIVVDDNSTDNTSSVYKQLQQIFNEEKLLLIERKGKYGIGSAYMDALKIVSGDFVVIMDADLSHHPKYIYDFIKRQKETNCDIVIGTRYNKKGGVSGWGFKRILVSTVANFLAQFLLFIKLTDLTGSFRLYKTEVLKEVIQKVDGKGYVFQMEIIVRAIKLGKIIEEVGYIFTERLFGKSKLSPNEIYKYILGLLKLFWTC